MAPPRVPVNPGDRFGRMVVLEEIPGKIISERFRRMFLLECDCGNKTEKNIHDLRHSGTRTCGYNCPLRFEKRRARAAERRRQRIQAQKEASSK